MAKIKQIKDTEGNVHDISVEWGNVIDKKTIVGYGTCATAAATAAKVATISDTSWTLAVGSIIGIKYTNSNTASSVTLNVNNTGAKNIWYNNAKYTSSSSSICGSTSRVIYYMYDGTYWVWLNMGSLDGNSDTKTSTSEKASTKLFLVGATAQSTSGQTTYSNSKCYVGTDNRLVSNGDRVTTEFVIVTYNELKDLRNNDLLIPGQQYRITDYVTTTAAVDTQSAGHQFDIVVTALDNSTLCEEAHVIHNRGDEYFDSCNLEAWKIWYCLDNDTNRFSWAKEYIQEYIPGLGSLYKFHNWVTAVAKVCDDQIDTFYETGINEKFSHFNYTENLDGERTLTLYGRNLDGDIDDGLDMRQLYHYKGVYNVDGKEYDGWAQLVINDDGSRNYANDGNGNRIYILTERIVYNGKIENGKGVIYRMIDEWGNDCPYDFKNIMFKKWLYADGGGITTEDNADYDEYCYTFSWQDAGDNIIDASIFGNNGYVTAEYGENKGVYGNVIGVWITGENGYLCQQLNSIVFLSTYMSDYGNYNGCYSNTFGDNCYSNIFGDNCNSNTFGNNCYYNTFGNRCYSNTFGNNLYSNTFGNNCYYNTIGNNLHSNTFVGYCYSNTFGNNCYSNTIGNSCYSNTFGSYCHYNTFDYYCHSNTFGNSCSNNTFGNNCYSNHFGNKLNSNTFGNNCYSNHFGNNCNSNTFGNNCNSNTFGNNCYENTFGNNCEYNTFGNNCYHNKFGNASSVKSYYRYIIFDDGNCYIYLYANASTSSNNYYQNVRIGLGVNNSTTYKTIADGTGTVGQTYETLYIPSNSQTKLV